MSAAPLDRLGSIIEATGRALRCLPEPVAALLDEQHAADGNEWSALDCPTLIGDANYYRDTPTDRVALVLWYEPATARTDARAFMFIEGHHDDAADSARRCSEHHTNRRAWWCPLDEPVRLASWREVTP